MQTGDSRNLRRMHTLKDRSAITHTREIYQFYWRDSYYTNTNAAIKHLRIQVNKLANIKKQVER